MTILFFPSLILSFVLSSHAFRPLHSGVRQRTQLDASSNDSLKFFLTGAIPKAPAPVYIKEAAADTPLIDFKPSITDFQSESLSDPASVGDVPDAVFTGAAENAAKSAEAVQQAAEEFRNGFEAATQSIDTDSLMKNTLEMGQSFRDGIQGMQNQFAAAPDYPVIATRLEYNPESVQKMAQNLRDSFQSIAGGSDGSDAPLLWEYVNNNLQKVTVPKLEPALKEAFAFPEAAFQETMKQLGELSTQPNWQAQQYLDVLNKEELKNWYWGAFFALIALGYLPALQNFRMFGDSAPPELSSLMKELNEMKTEKQIRDRDMEELRTEMKMFLDTVQGGRALEKELAEELQLAKETNLAQAKQIEMLQGENESLREQIKQLTVVVSDLKSSLDLITCINEEMPESFFTAPVEVGLSQSKASVPEVSEEAPSSSVPEEAEEAPKASAPEVVEETPKASVPKVAKETPKTKKAASNKKTASKKAPSKGTSRKSKPTSVEIVDNGEDWSTLTVSTLNRKTVKDLVEYLESKGATGVDSDGKPLKKAELVDAVMSVKV